MTREELLDKYLGGERDFSGIDLKGSNLSGCDLRVCDLRGSNLSGCDLSGCNLRVCDLRGSNLSGSDLSGCNLSGCNLKWSNLSWSNLSGCNLSGCNLAGSIGLPFADCAWSGHGERGRRLLGVVIGGEVRLFCGCFRGTKAELREYIANGSESLRASRTKALDFVLSCLEVEPC